METERTGTGTTRADDRRESFIFHAHEREEHGLETWSGEHPHQQRSLTGLTTRPRAWRMPSRRVWRVRVALTLI